MKKMILGMMALLLVGCHADEKGAQKKTKKERRRRTVMIGRWRAEALGCRGKLE